MSLPKGFKFSQEEKWSETKELNLCHKCDNINGYCSNPQHLFLGSQNDNIQDMIKKGRYNGGCTSESAKKGVETRRKFGTLYRGGWSDVARKRSAQVRAL
jgi:hypothetical protein